MAASGLDLRAIERFVQHREELRRPIDGTLDMVVALLVHVRALRAALTWAKRLHNHRSDMRGPNWTAWKEQATVVLGAAQDGEDTGGLGAPP